MLYDLKGGEFNVSILNINIGVAEVFTSAGKNGLGGDDFDSYLVDYLIKKFKMGNR
jgi:molecular chaperone DnaK